MLLMRQPPRGHREQDGFTLLELLVVMLILGVVGGMTMTSLVRGMNTSSRATARVETLTTLEMAGQRAAREIRRGTWVSAYADTTSQSSPTSSTPRECVLPATGSSVSDATLKSDGLSVVTLHSGQRYRTRLAMVNGELTMDTDRWVDATTGWVDESRQILATGLTNVDNNIPLFTYLDADGAVIPPSATGTYGTPEIERVAKVELRFRADASGTDPIEVRTIVAPRNGGSACPRL